MPHGGTRMCPGARRSFFCRMKCKAGMQVKDETDVSSNGSTCHRRKTKMGSGENDNELAGTLRILIFFLLEIFADKKYLVIQCTGYLKSWAPAKIGLDEHQESSDCDPESYNLSCLVAVGRIQPNPYHHYMNTPSACIKTIQFLSRHAMDGKFLFVDQR